MTRRGSKLAVLGTAFVVGTAAAAVPVLAGGGADPGSDGSALIAATQTDPGTQSDPGTQTDPGAPAPPNAPAPPTDEQRAQRKAELDAARQTYEKAFADALGVTVEQVEAAQEKARGAVLLTQLDDLVSSGRLTQAEADALKAAVANGTLDETLKAQARTRLESRLEEAVSSGRITQAQADEMLKRFDESDGDGPFGGRGFGFGFGPGFGFDGPGFGGRGHHGHRDFRGGPAPDQNGGAPEDAPQDGGSTPGSAPRGGSRDSTA
jgi:hypothetical protein